MAKSDSARSRADERADEAVAARNFLIDELRKRCEDLGYELVISDAGEQFLLGGKHGLEVVFICRKGCEEDADLGDWLRLNGDKHAQYNPDDDETLALRGDVESVLRGVRSMVQAIDEEDALSDERISTFAPVIYREIARALEVLEKAERAGGAA